MISSPMPMPLSLRVFLASPGDVSDERALALKVLEQLPYDPLLRGRITIEAVAWDKPGTDTPMLATLTPQEAIKQGLPRPSECDTVVVIFWSRMGTPLPAEWTRPDGSRYRSGTEWEYWDAVDAAKQHGRPAVLVYRRTERLALDPEDPAFEEKHRQWQRVKTFFQSFVNPDDQSIRGGVNEYATPDEFREKLSGHLRDLIARWLKAAGPDAAEPVAQPVSPAAEPELWPGSPFPGLRALTPNDAPIFFGRGRETDDLIGRLAREHRFIAVVGASGSGKSSLVAAGLLPRLADNAIPGSRDWAQVRFTPGEYGDNPFMALAAGFKALLEPHGRRLRDEAERLYKDAGALNELVSLALDGRPDWGEVLLFIDQFEELFTVVGERYREPFIVLLKHAGRRPRVRLVLTMRADFYHRCVAQPALAALLRTGSYPLAAPGVGALYEMITGPAARAGLEFQEGLVERILSDTGTEPGALPLMAFALAELYKTREPDGRLTQAEYDRFDGVQGAISKRAEDTFKALDKEAQATLDYVFRELVEVEEAEDGWVATRRRAPLAEVAKTPVAESLVAAFTEARLLVQGRGEHDRPVMEVAHEALLRSWPRLVQWIKDNGEALRIRRECRDAARDWREHDQDEAYLYRGARLSRAEAWAQHHADMVGEKERAFLQTSLALRDAERRREEAQRERELEAARELAAARRRTVLGLTVGLVLAVVIAVVAMVQWDRADRQTALAERHAELARRNTCNVQMARAREVLEQSPLLARALLNDTRRCPIDLHDVAWRFLYRLSQRDMLRNLASGQERATLQGHTGSVWSVAFAPDGRTLASASGDRTIKLWDAASGQERATLQGHTGSVLSVAFAPDGRTLASASGDGTVKLWDAASGQVRAILQGHTDSVSSVAFAPDGRTLASASADGTVKLWDAASGQERTTLQGHTGDVYAVAFAPDGRTLASASGDGTVKLWDAVSGQISAILQGHIGGVFSVAFASDGWTLASASGDHTIKLWKAASGQDGATRDLQRSWQAAEPPWDTASGQISATFQISATLQGHIDGVFSVAFAPDGRTLASASWDGTVKLWDAASDQGSATLQGHTGSVFSVAFAPDGQTLASASGDGTVKLWDARTDR